MPPFYIGAPAASTQTHSRHACGVSPGAPRAPDRRPGVARDPTFGAGCGADGKRLAFWRLKPYVAALRLRSRLIPTQAEKVWFRFVRLEARVRLAMTARLKGVGLSVAQTDVLSTLTEREGISQQELAQRLYVTKGNISGLIDRLEAVGYVERRSLASDRRSHAIHLTDAGRLAASRGVEAQRAFVRETLGRLDSEDLDEFDRLIQSLRDQVRALADGDAGDA